MPFILIPIIIIFFLLFDAVFVVKQKTSAIVERFGKFKQIASPGLNFKLPIIDKVVCKQSLRIQQLDVEVETKTLDNVFIITKISVQFRVLTDKVKESFYQLEDPYAQIESYIFDTVRSEIPKLKLDEVFSNKDSVAHSIKESLSDAMLEYGYVIANSLVTDLQPDNHVKESMNRINATERDMLTASNEADALKIKKVKAAEADAEAKKLQGRGLAQQRLEIARGIRESIETIKESGVSEEEVMTLLLVTQHYDAVQDMAKSANSNTVMLNYSPSGIANVADQIREAVLSVKDQPGLLKKQNS